MCLKMVFKLWCVLCVILMSLSQRVHGRGSMMEHVAEITETCCDQGTAFARNQTSTDCSAAQPPQNLSTGSLNSLCVYAMDNCCEEYFKKKKDCDSGVDKATSTRTCSDSTDAEKSCCNECLRGTSVGSAQGVGACVGRGGTKIADILGRDAFEACCKSSAKETGEPEVEARNAVTLSRPASVDSKASICEEYAPNELCAHHCIPVPGSYKCECNPGFKLMTDGRNCMEVTKNRCKPRNPCQHKCNDNGVEIKCSCRRGYQLKPDGKKCEDIDECQLDPPLCPASTQCYNVQGSYKCIPKKTTAKDVGQCPAGFVRNARNNVCDDVNECTLSNPPCPSYLCENTVGGYKCGGTPGDPANLAPSRPAADDRCPPGFRSGLNEECEDVDECALHKDDCNPLSQFCINTRGSFYCQDKVSKHCPPGLKINPNSNRCEDIDECEDSQDICRPDQVCVNLPGSYDCKLKDEYRVKNKVCPEGKRLSPTTNNCEDIDECAEGTHLCDMHQHCINTDGSHECTCRSGFRVDHITGSCVDINECATDENNCISGSQRCDNTVGSYLCVRFIPCGTGYVLHATTGLCEDIDECDLGTHNCARAGPNWYCENEVGSFKCKLNKTATTTSTTPAQPFYDEEWEYYDSDEELDTKKNDTKPAEPNPENRPDVVPTTTPTLPPTPPPTTPRIEPTPEAPPQIDTRFSQPESERPQEPKQPDQIPERNQPDQKPSYYDQNPVYPEEPSTPKPYHPAVNTEQQKPEDQRPEEPDQRNFYQPSSTDNDSANPESTDKPEGRPSLVFVRPGIETATVKAEKKDDGSVVVDTKDVPKNEWTKVNQRPSVKCQLGFGPNEHGLCADIDECATNRHSCSGLTEVCRNTVGGYLCDCAPSFRRDMASGMCEVFVTNTRTTTSTTTQKDLFWGGYESEYRPTSRPFRPRTLCDVGYHYNTKTSSCEDIDECSNGQAHCAAVEVCMNTAGGYRCECPPNWSLDDLRHRCIPDRPAGELPVTYIEPSQRPLTPSDFQQTFKGTKYVDPEVTRISDQRSVMACPNGYQLDFDNACEDIDECATGQASCGNMLCTNLPGGYVCSCPAGHKLNDGNRCEDVDECALGGNVPVCSQNADCLNTVGSYQCKCHTGFRSAPVNDKVCMDVDECSESPSGSLCQHRCNNVWGGYTCSCHRGYRLNPDNRTCSDVDECTEFKSKIPCVGHCVNEPGSYRCTCPRGYRLSEDKRSCIDIDECENGDAPCAKSSGFGISSDVCLNTRGGYRCQRIVCPAGYKLENRHRCTRIEKMCPPADYACAHQPTTYSYNFITFVSKLFIPASKVDLFTMRGPSWPNAIMRFNLRLVNVDAPPSVREKADIGAFLLVNNANQAVMSLVRSLEGPQSIELELSMELYNGEQFGGIAIARLYIFVSEFEF